MLAIVAGSIAIAGLGYALTQTDVGDGVSLRTRGKTVAGGADLTPVDGNWNAMAAANRAGTTPAPATTPPAPAIAAIPLVARTEAEHIVQTQTLANVMMPRLKDGVVTGFTIREGSMPPVFARAGVRVGDFMVSINGRALDSNAMVSGLSRDLAPAAHADIVVERDGARQTLSASLRG